MTNPFFDTMPETHKQGIREAIRDKHLRVAKRLPRYGGSKHWRDAWEHPRIMLKDAPTLLDIGTGQGQLIHALWVEGCKLAVGVDCIDYGWQKRSHTAPGGARGWSLHKMWAHDLGVWKDRAFEYVTAFDSLEHLAPFDVKQALREMVRVCSSRIVVSICYHPSHVKDRDSGEGLHESVFPEDWWKASLLEAMGGGDIQKVDQYLVCELP